MLTLLVLTATHSALAEDYVSGEFVFAADCAVDSSTNLAQTTDASAALKVFGVDSTGTQFAGVPKSCVLTIGGVPFSGASQLGVKLSTPVTYGSSAAVKSGVAGDLLKADVTKANTGEEQSKAKFSVLIDPARAYSSEHLVGLPHGVDYRIVVLPDGSTLPEKLPSGVDENDVVEFDVIYPKGGIATLTPTCGDSAGQVRILDSYSVVSGMIKVESGEAPADPKTVELTHHAVTVSCGTKMTVKAAVAAAGFEDTESEIAMDIDNLYRFSWGLGLGFDTGMRASGVEVDTETSTDDTGAEITTEYVGGSEAMSGPTALVLLNVHLAPYSKTFSTIKERPWSSLAISGGVDPARLTKGGVLGLTFIPIPGLGITGGGSFFASEQATDGAGNSYALGDPWETSRDLEVRNSWGKDALGIWLGLNLTGALREAVSASSDQGAESK